jgi:predicted PhzF superfamily epimerase YddE/YHI9
MRRSYDSRVAELHALRVFTDAQGNWGNPLGVFLDGEQVPDGERQPVAAALGFSETVFVDDRAGARLAIHTPTTELPFAGHPTVGTAWLLAARGGAAATLRPPAGAVRVLVADERGARVAAPAEWAPGFEYRRLASPREVDALEPAAAHGGNLYAWAWLDEAAGLVRARSFPHGEGIEEDEATGSAALALCARLGRPLRVSQGRGSLIEAEPLGDGTVAIGGFVVLDEVREHEVP